MQRGFTLVELLIVIAVIAVLAASVFVALNPAQRFLASRDAKRTADVEAVASALKTYQTDNAGSYPASVTALTAGSFYMIGTAGAGCDTGCTAKTTQAACVDLTALVTGGYTGSVPMDPSSGTAATTLYYMSRNSTGTVEVGACIPEGGAAISVTR